MLEVTKGNPILTYNMVNPINHPPNHHFYIWEKNTQKNVYIVLYASQGFPTPEILQTLEPPKCIPLSTWMLPPVIYGMSPTMGWNMAYRPFLSININHFILKWGQCHIQSPPRSTCRGRSSTAPCRGSWAASPRGRRCGRSPSDPPGPHSAPGHGTGGNFVWEKWVKELEIHGEFRGFC